MSITPSSGESGNTIECVLLGPIHLLISVWLSNRFWRDRSPYGSRLPGGQHQSSCSCAGGQGMYRTTNVPQFASSVLGAFGMYWLIIQTAPLIAATAVE